MEHAPSGETETVVREYILGVRIVEVERPDETVYRFEAPQHIGKTFSNRDHAELYADIYFDVNGFEEEGTGERGLPPEVVQAGRDTMAAYLLTQFGDDNYVASFYGVRTGKVHEYVSWVQERAEEVRDGARREGVAEER